MKGRDFFQYTCLPAADESIPDRKSRLFAFFFWNKLPRIRTGNKVIISAELMNRENKIPIGIWKMIIFLL